MAKVTELPLAEVSPLGSDELVMVQNGQVVRVSLFALSAYLANPVAPPVFADPPAIVTDGTPAVGETITFDFGTVVGGSVAGAALLRGSTVIVEELGGSYILAAADEGQQLRIRVTATGDGGSVQATSAPIGPIGEAPPANRITGTRLALMGDSRLDNGIGAQRGNRTTGVPAANRLQSMPGWMLHELGHPMDIIGQWTLGGSKSSQSYHDHALAVIAARNPHAVFLLDSTNDPVDYSGTGGLLPVPLGDLEADPATQPRVGAAEPGGNGANIQGTTIGNIDKAIRFWGDPVANGLGRVVPVILVAIPTENPGRRLRNRQIYLWGQAQIAARRYPNLIAPQIYPLLLSDPAMIDGPIGSETVRTDLNDEIGVLFAAGDVDAFLHPSPAGARLIGQMLAADPQIIAAFSGRPSVQVLPDGTNDAAFINPNPSLQAGTTPGTLGWAGSNTPLPTGVVPQHWELGHRVGTGTISLVSSLLPGGGMRVTMERTGGADNTEVGYEVRQASIPITLVAGDAYVIEAEVALPARAAQDVYSARAFIAVRETGLLNDRGEDISTVDYGSFASNSPNPFAKDGDVLRLHGVPFEATPAMVASATGTVPLSARLEISFRRDIDTSVNGPLVVDIKSLGIRKYTLAEAHRVPPVQPPDTPPEPDAPPPPPPPPPPPSPALTALKARLDGGENNGIWNLTSATGGGGTLTIADLSSNGNNLVQSASTRHPAIDPVNGATFDGANDAIGFAWKTAAPATATVVLRMTKTVGQTQKTLISDGTLNNSGGQYHQNNTAQIGPVGAGGTWSVNGVTVTTRDAFDDALEAAAGAEVTVIGTGVNVSTWPALFLSRISGAHAGRIRRAVAIDDATANLAASITDAVAFVEDTA